MRARALRAAAGCLAMVFLAPSPAAAQQPPAQAARPSLEPPKLERFVDADYPPEARAAGLSAEVLLQIAIDAEGRVTDVEVKQPAGHGFDEAAVRAARQFAFSPARRDGKPVASRIAYRYAFTLKPDDKAPEAPSPAAPGAPEAPRGGALRGSVRMGDGDDPLAAARVVVTPRGGSPLVVTTDAEGKWQVSSLPPGPVRVQIEAPGFDGASSDEQVGEGELVEITQRLRPSGGSGLEVSVKGERPDREVTRRTLERSELARVPGTNGDALRAVQSMPGVARSPGLSGMLIVRGTEPAGTQVWIDGAWTPRVYHFGGLSSVVPTEMIETLDFYPGNFGAQYGRANGGIVAVKTRAIAPDGEYHALGQVDLIDARAMVEGPVPGLPSWRFIAGARRSHLDAWLGPVLRSGGNTVRSAPVYYDYQAFVETNPSARSTFRMGFFGSDDRLALVFSDPSALEPGVGSSLGQHDHFWRAVASYNGELGEGVNARLNAVYGGEGEDQQVGGLHATDSFRVFASRGEIAARVSPEVLVRAGHDVIHAPYTADVSMIQIPRPGEPDPGPVSQQRVIRFVGDGSITWSAGYAEAELTPVERLKMTLGLRADHDSRNAGIDWGERVNARYDLVPGPGRTTVKVAAGRYYQPPQVVEAVRGFGTPGVLSNRSAQYSAGFEQELGERAELSVEGFYKDLDRLVSRTLLPDGTQGYDNAGSGRVFGAETLLRFRPGGRFFGWVAYTFSRSTRRDRPGAPERTFEYDQPHVLTALAGVELGRGWQLGGRFRLVSGNPYTPCEGGLLEASTGAYLCKSGAPYSARLPAFHSLDVRVEKMWRFDSWRLTAYLDVQNAYNRKNPEAVSYNYAYTQTEYRAGLPLLPSLGLRGEL